MSNAAFSTSRTITRRWLAGAARWLWQWLRRPWLAIVAGLIGALLALAVWLLPQLPGQLVDEQAAAATWLVTTSTNYGIWGNFLLALGFFDVLRSPLLYLLLALLVPTVAAQLADQLGALRQQQWVQRCALNTRPHTAGDAIPLADHRPLYRWREVVSYPPEHLVPALEQSIRRNTQQVSITIAPLVETAISTTPTSSTSPNNAEAQATASTETRILGIHRAQLQYVRPLLMVGLLICVAGAWLALAFGWQATAPPLAPGGVFRSANRGLTLYYSVPTTSTQRAVLHASLLNAKSELPIHEATQQRLGAATILLRPTWPAIWITTASGEADLTLPGEAKLRAAIGLVFANPGSESSVLIPAEGAGLRIVQRTGSTGFVLELYSSDAIQPVYRAELPPGGQLTIPLTEGETELVVTSLPGLQVDVRQLPGLRLVPLGIVLALLGAMAYGWRSGFVVAQVAPWGGDASVVVLQADQLETVAQLRAAITALVPQATPAAGVEDSQISGEA